MLNYVDLYVRVGISFIQVGQHGFELMIMIYYLSYLSTTGNDVCPKTKNLAGIEEMQYITMI